MLSDYQNVRNDNDGSKGESSMSGGRKEEVKFRTEMIQGRLRINQGPFSTYKPAYRDNTSVIYSLFSSSFTYQDCNDILYEKMNLVFSRSNLSSSYSHTEIVNISSGSVIVDFILHFLTPVDIYESTPNDIAEIIKAGMDKSLFVVAKSSVRISPIESSTVITTPTPGVCVPTTIEECINATDWSVTTFPNILGHTSPQEIRDARSRYQELFFNSCGKDFWCTVFNPNCVDSRSVPPCREYCKVVYRSCAYESLDPNALLNCDTLPDSSDPNVCTQDPYEPGKCITNTDPKCQYYGFDQISFPNFAAMRNKLQAAEIMQIVEGVYQSTKCYKYSMLFGCAAFMPKCSGTGEISRHAIPPCKSLCNAYKTRCSIFMDIFWYPWPSQLYCDILPDSANTSICIGYKEAHEIPELEECPAGEDRCDNETCIPLSWKCDGYSDCQDGSDEAAIQTTLPLRKCVDCQDDMFRCSFGSLCIESSQRCNGIEDCSTATDEKECVKLEDGRHGLLTIYNPQVKGWTPVCSSNWETEQSNRVCKQLGYTNSLSQDTVSMTSQKYFQLLDVPKNGTNSKYISSQLTSVNTCSSGRVIKITCGHAICGIRPAFVHPALRVVGGDIADPNAWPWHVSFFGGTDEKYFCGGTIIDEMWILTAGHCIGGRKTPKDLLLRAGQPRRDTYSKYEQELHPVELILHENYAAATVDNDIALVKLDKPIIFNDHVRPACLPTSDEKLRTGTRCTVYGWGKQGDLALDYERQIREVNLEVTDWTHCDEAIENAKLHTFVPYKLTEHMFCAGGGVGHDSCAGDSGGPFLCPTDATKSKWYIGGIVSWGVACALDHVPGIYTNVPGYLDWIRNKTGLDHL
ncbi:Transmembrane protease serine 2 [Mactra antiquata]